MQASETRYRTHTCGQLRQSDVGQTVKLAGWVHSYRDHGGLVFIDLRDRDGLTQLVFDPDACGKAITTNPANSARNGSSASPARSPPAARSLVNPKLPTGEIEVRVKDAGGPQHLAHAAVHARRARNRQRRKAAGLPLSRPSPRRDADKPAHALSRDQNHARLSRRSGILGNRNAVPHQINARRGARFHRALAPDARAVFTPCRNRRSFSSSF